MQQIFEETDGLDQPDAVDDGDANGMRRGGCHNAARSMRVHEAHERGAVGGGDVARRGTVWPLGQVTLGERLRSASEHALLPRGVGRRTRGVGSHGDPIDPSTIDRCAALLIATPTASIRRSPTDQRSRPDHDADPGPKLAASHEPRPRARGRMLEHPGALR